MKFYLYFKKFNFVYKFLYVVMCLKELFVLLLGFDSVSLFFIL